MTDTTTAPKDQIAVRGYIHDMLQELLGLAESRRLDDVAGSIRTALSVYPTDPDGAPD